MVDAGNYPMYLSSAFEWFKRHLGVGGYDHVGPARTYRTPAKALSLAYMGSLWPDDVFDIVLFAGGIGTRTNNVLAEARRTDDGQTVFAGRLTSMYGSTQDRRQTVAVPGQVRQCYADYRDRHRAPDSLTQAVAR